MGKDRLSWLALLHFHYEKSMDLDMVVNLFSKKHPRRMELDEIVACWTELYDQLSFAVLFIDVKISIFVRIYK